MNEHPTPSAFARQFPKDSTGLFFLNSRDRQVVSDYEKLYGAHAGLVCRNTKLVNAALAVARCVPCGAFRAFIIGMIAPKAHKLFGHIAALAREVQS